MKRNIGNGKTVRSTEWLTSTKCLVTYTDGSKEELTRQAHKQLIK